MHKNLVQVQQNFIANVKNILEVLEHENKRPLILSALMVSEKPLNTGEIAERTGLPPHEVQEGIQFFMKKEILMEVKKHDEISYEFNPDLDRIIAKRIRTKGEKILNNMENHLKESRELILSGKEEYEPYDHLMAKFLFGRLKRAEFIHRFLSKKMFLLNFLETGELPPQGEIKKIDIE